MARIFVLIPAGGGGARFGGTAPKQYAALAGKPLLLHTLLRLQQALSPELTVVALSANDIHYEREIGRRDGVMTLHCGGSTRAATVDNALRAMRDTCGEDDWVLVHDAARPCVPADALRRLVAHLEHDETGGLLAIPVADTLKRSDGDADAPRVLSTADRTGLWQAQTPQMFRYAALTRAFAHPGALECTDEAQAVEAVGGRPRLVRGSPANIKVTFMDDLALAAAIVAAQTASGEMP
jgi:2-C-methyl-D-erythritol 4-phosphate cytidylyltransferase